MAKLKVVLLFGGRSSEHSISCATAAGVMGAIDRSKYDLIPVGITQSGLFVPADDNASKWALRKGELATVKDEGARIEFAMDGSRNATPQGLQTAENFAKTLAGRGLCIISGLALGIESGNADILKKIKSLKRIFLLMRKNAPNT